MKIITPPTVEPVSVAEVKAQLGITDNVTEDILTRRITEARKWAENYTKRALISQTREIRWDHFIDEHQVPSALSIDSVKYIDIDGNEVTVPSIDYVLDAYSDIAFVTPAYNATWPSTRTERNAVRILFKAGYGTKAEQVEPLIREAIILLVGHWTNFQKQSEDESILAHVPRAIERMLDPYSITRYLV